MKTNAPYDTLYFCPVNYKIVGSKHIPVHEELFNDKKNKLSTQHATNHYDEDVNKSDQRLISLQEQREDYQRFPPFTTRRDFASTQPLPPISSPTSSIERSDDGEITQLLYLLPRNIYLPNEALILSNQHKDILMRKLAISMRSITTSQLKAVYLDLVHHDWNLLGYVSYEDLQITLLKNNIIMSTVLLRILGAMFVDKSGKVNYEQILSTMDSAVKMNNELDQYVDHSFMLLQDRNVDVSFDENSLSKLTTISPRSYNSQTYRQQDNKGVYYKVKEPPFQHELKEKVDLPKNYSDIKIHQELQSQVKMLSGINTEGLRNSFQRLDSLCRGTLSAEQIRAICIYHRLPVSRAFLSSLIERCRRKDDWQEYDWHEFLAFFDHFNSKGLAHHDYVENQKSSSSRTVPAALYTTNSLYGAGIANESSSKNVQLTPRFVTKINNYKESDPQPSLSPSFALRQDDFFKNQPAHPIVSHDFINKSVAMSWFDRFLKLTDAIYKYDTQSQGYLSHDLLKRLIHEYNDKYGLGLSHVFVENALRICTGANIDRVNVSQLLKELVTQKPK